MSLTNKVAQFDADSDLVNAWVHGPASGVGSTVITESGAVRTPAKLIADKEAQINVDAAGVLALSTAQAGISTAQAVIATTQAELATTNGAAQVALAVSQVVLATTEKTAAVTAKTAAELAATNALISAGSYATEVLGRVAVADGVAFKVQGSGEVAAYEYRRINAGTVSTLIATYPSSSAILTSQAGTAREDAIVFVDADDNMALAITAGGDVEMKKAKILGGILDSVNIQNTTLGEANVKTETTLAELAVAFCDDQNNLAFGITNKGDVQVSNVSHEVADVIGMTWAITDVQGNIAFGIKDDSTLFIPGISTTPAVAASAWTTLSLGTDDAIGHIGDSYTASHYVLKDKSYISQLSALSPYRHMNFGVSGNDALDMQYRIVNNSAYDGKTFAAMKLKYAFITTLTNDTFFRVVDETYYAENIRRLIETVRAVGTEPIVTTEFPATVAEHALLRRIADETGCAFIDCTSHNKEIGGLVGGPFHQGHPGTRTGGVFWLPMLEYIDRMPKPTRAIKVYRRRATHTVTGIVDLLYKDRIDRNKKWKEISVAHYLLDDAGKFEELNQLGTFGYLWQVDEYNRLAAKQTVAVADYALMEITLPGTSLTLDAVEITVTASTAATVYVRDYLDVAASLPGRAQGAAPADATYLSKWDKPRGAWRSIGTTNTPLVIAQASLKNSMQGNKLIVMVAGAFDLTDLQVRYQGREVATDLRNTRKYNVTGAELLTQPLCGTASQLADWVTAGTPVSLVPIDNYNSPRKPGTSVAVDGVCTISSTKTIGQVVVVPADAGKIRTFRVTAWARYFPKAFLNPALYPTLDAAQIIDRIANPTLAPITTDTADLRTLKFEFWDGAGAYPTEGGAEFFSFAALQWRPVEFDIELLPYRASTSLSFRLSCPDGEIQVSKVSFKEVLV